MTFNDYIPLAMRTQNGKLTDEENLRHALCGLVSEVFEFKCEQSHNHLAAIYEAGDVCWMVAELCSYYKLGIDDNEILPSGYIELTDTTVAKLMSHIQKTLQGTPLDLKFIRSCLVNILHETILSACYCCDWSRQMKMSEAMERTLDLVLRRNIEKLMARYPNGFDEERSVNRDE